MTLQALSLISASYGAVYLELESHPKRPWQTCYTGSKDQAKHDLLNRRFVGGNDVDVRDIQTSGEALEFDVYYFGEKMRRATMPPCVFTEADQQTQVRCEVTVQDKWANALGKPLPIDKIDGYLLAVDREWKDQGVSVVDCTKQRVRVIRNTWIQPMSVMDVKLLTAIAQVYKMPLIAPAMGALKKTPGLNPLQPWSAELHPLLMTESNFQEIFDASIEQFSAPGELDNWLRENGESWTPWGVQFVQIRCDGFLPIVDPGALEWLSLDMSSSAVQSYCQSSR